MPKYQIGIAATLNIFKKHQYYLKTKEPIEKWLGGKKAAFEVGFMRLLIKREFLTDSEEPLEEAFLET